MFANYITCKNIYVSEENCLVLRFSVGFHYLLCKPSLFFPRTYEWTKNMFVSVRMLIFVRVENILRYQLFFLLEKAPPPFFFFAIKLLLNCWLGHYRPIITKQVSWKICIHLYFPRFWLPFLQNFSFLILTSEEILLEKRLRAETVPYWKTVWKISQLDKW